MDKKTATDILDEVRQQKQAQAPGGQHSSMVAEGGPAYAPYRQKPPQGKTRPQLPVRKLPSKDKIPHDPREGTPSPWHYLGKPTGAFKPQLELKTPRASDNFMDEKTAQGILDKVRQQKQADDPVSSAARWLVGRASSEEEADDEKTEKAVERNLRERRARRIAAARWDSEKEGRDPITDVLDQLNQQKAKALRGEAMKDIMNVALASLGAGAAIRGGKGLYDMVTGVGSKPVALSPAVLDVPYPAPEDEEEDEEARKLSSDMLSVTPRLSANSERAIEQQVASGKDLRGSIKSAYAHWNDELVEDQADSREKLAGWWSDTFLEGTGAEEKGSLPWYPGGLILGTAAGGYAGWKAIDKILDSRRKAEAESRLDKARKEFNQALLSQYDDDEKQSSQLGRQLDDLYDKMTKVSGIMPDKNDWSRMLALYGAYAIPASVISGLWAYNATAKRRRKAILEKAVKKRRKRQQVLSPAEIYARPVPLPIDKEEEEGQEA